MKEETKESTKERRNLRRNEKMKVGSRVDTQCHIVPMSAALTELTATTVT